MRHLLLFFTALLLTVAPGSPEAREEPDLRAGAWETGVAMALSSVAGESRVRINLRTGTFLHLASSTLLNLEGDLGWQSRASLDEVELGLSLHGVGPVGGGPIWFHGGLGAGIRVTTVGAFRETHTPVGINLGFRTLASRSLALRVDYRYRRVLGDAVADFDEHHVLLGISYLWNNGR